MSISLQIGIWWHLPPYRLSTDREVVAPGRVGQFDVVGERRLVLEQHESFIGNQHDLPIGTVQPDSPEGIPSLPGHPSQDCRDLVCLTLAHARASVGYAEG